MDTQRTDGTARRAPPAFFSLAALWGFAVAQPLYDLLRASPEFFIEHGIDRRGLAIFVIVLSALAPLALTAVVKAARRLSDRLGASLLLTLLVTLAVAFGAQIAGRLPGPPGLTVAVALLLGAGLVVICYRWGAAQGALCLAGAAALVVFPAFFLSAPAIRGLWLPAAPIESLQGGTGAPIVILLLDELPLASLLDGDDRIEARHFPSFAALAGTSTWYRNATAIATSTRHSVTSLLTGSPSTPSRAPVAAEYPRSLFTALAGSYEMRVVERVTKLCPAELCPPPRVARSDVPSTFGRDLVLVYLHLVTPGTWRSRLAPIDQTWGAFGDAVAAKDGARLDPRIDTPLVLRHVIAGIEPRSSPILFYLHLMLPHVPWKYLPTGQEYTGLGKRDRAPGLSQGSRQAVEWEVVQAYQRHLLQVAFTDRLLGEFVGALERNDLFDDSLIVLAADHGATFIPGKRRRAGPDSLNVPLMIKRPGQKEGQILDRHATLLDILPTVLEVVELETDWPMRGRALFPEAPVRRRATPEERQISEGRQRAVRQKLDWFPAFGETGGLFQIGPHRELIGRQPEPLRTATGTPPASVELARPWLYEDVDPAGPFVPACVSGRLAVAPGGRRARRLAVAINDRIAGVTRTVGGEDTRFSVMVEPAAFAPGRNRVDVYQMLDRPHPALVPLPLTGREDYRLSTEGDRTFLTLPGGERLAVRTVAAKDFRLRHGLNALIITGRLELPPDGSEPFALLFDGERALGPIPVNRSRATRRRFKRLKRFVPFALAPDPDALRVVVVSGDSAWRQEVRLASPKLPAAPARP